MGVFEFIIILVVISTVGKVISDRRPRRDPRGGLPQGGARAELERIRETVDDLGGRLVRLEEERDFYKELLDSPGRRGAISPPDTVEDASDLAEPS